MKKILSAIGLTGDKGLIGLISEKTGKISFKRSAAIIVLTTIVAPDVFKNGLSWMNVVLCIACIATPALTEIFNKSKQDRFKRFS